MRLRNTADKFGLIAQGFHWVVALCVIALLAVGIYMTDLDPSPQKFQIHATHKSVGILVLALVLCRLGWRFFNPPPPGLSTHKPWEKILARIVHWFFYGALFLMPLSGWVMSSAKGFPVSFFGLFTLPDLVSPSESAAKAANEFHEILSNILIAAIIFHVAGALKHHIIDRDGTLRRMLPVFLFAVLSMTAMAVYAADEKGDRWAIDAGASKLSFEGKQQGAAFGGVFGAFTGDIVFSADSPETGYARIVIDMKSVDTNSKDRDSYIAKPEWFDVAAFPEAVYEIQKFGKAEDGSYIAHGALTLRGVTIPVDLPFTLILDETGKTATVSGEAVLKRLDFGIGQGEWKDEQAVANDVSVTVDLVATKN